MRIFHVCNLYICLYILSLTTDKFLFSLKSTFSVMLLLCHLDQTLRYTSQRHTCQPDFAILSISSSLFLHSVKYLIGTFSRSVIFSVSSSRLSMLISQRLLTLISRYLVLLDFAVFSDIITTILPLKRTC